LTWWVDYQTRRGQDRKTLYSNNMKNVISNKFESSTSYELVTINGVSRDVRITEESSVTRNPYKKRLLCKPDETIVVGDIVVWDSDNWICIKNDDTSSIVDVGVIEKCNNTLKFYSTTDSTLHQIPCIITNKITLSEDENKYLSTVDNQVYMMCISTSITQQIKPNDIFKLGIYNYQIVTIPDDISIPGILIFKMKYSEVEATTHVFTLEILNGSVIDLQESTTLQLNVDLYDNGVLVSPTPLLTFTSSDETICTVSSTGLVTALDVIDDCVIGVSCNGVSDSIVVEVIENVQHNITVEITSGNSSIVVNKSSAYACTFRDNGIDVPGTSVFYLTADDGVSSTNLATISSQDSVENSCIVQGNALGYVMLWVKNESGDVVSQPIRIQIKNIF